MLAKEQVGGMRTAKEQTQGISITMKHKEHAICSTVSDVMDFDPRYATCGRTAILWG